MNLYVHILRQSNDFTISFKERISLKMSTIKAAIYFNKASINLHVTNNYLATFSIGDVTIIFHVISQEILSKASSYLLEGN